MQTMPNYVDIERPNEVQLFVRHIASGSKRIDTFSSERGKYQVGDEFVRGGQRYIIEAIYQ